MTARTSGAAAVPPWGLATAAMLPVQLAPPYRSTCSRNRLSQAQHGNTDLPGIRDLHSKRLTTGATLWTNPDMTPSHPARQPGTPNWAICAHPYQGGCRLPRVPIRRYAHRKLMKCHEKYLWVTEKSAIR